MKNEPGLYQTAHVFVSAIRVLEYTQQAPPGMQAVCELMQISLEQGHFLSAQLKDMGVCDLLTGASGDRLFIKDHLELEKIPQGPQDNKMAAAIKQFQDSREGLSQKIKELQSKKAEQKKSLFAELEMKLKKGIDKP